MENSFLNNIRINSRDVTPMHSDFEYKRLQNARDVNKSAVIDAIGQSFSQFGIGVPVGLVTHLADSIMALPQLAMNPEQFAEDTSHQKMGQLTDRLIEGLFETGPMAKAKKNDESEMHRTSSKAKEANKEQSRRAAASQIKMVDLLDPSNFIKNLRKN
jgi:hypothetical protein